MAQSEQNIYIIDKQVITLQGIYQYDYGLTLKINVMVIEDGTEIHFTQNGIAITDYVIDNKVKIPDYMLSFNDTVSCYIYVTDTNSGKTISKIIIPINARQKPGDYITPEEPSYSRLLPLGGEEGQILSIVNGEYAWVNSSGSGPLPVQSDWNNTDNTSLAYIRNKPENLSDFINDENFLQAVPGSGLITDEEKIKLQGIANGANKNVQADWDNTSPTADAYIKNKPTMVSEFYNDAGYISEIGNSIIFDTVTSDNFSFEGRGKLRTTFGTPSVLTAAIVPGVFNSKFDFYNMDYIKFYCSDTEELEDWVEYTPINYSENNKGNLFSGDLGSNITFPLGLHKRYLIEISNIDSSTYYWLNYFTLICNSQRSRISFEMKAYTGYSQGWETIVEKQEATKTNELYPLEVMHKRLQFDIRETTGKYQKIRYTFCTHTLGDPNNPSSSVNNFILYKFRHFGTYPSANSAALGLLKNGIMQDNQGNTYVRGKFKKMTNQAITDNNDLTDKQYVDQQIANIMAILARNNIT